MTTQTPHLQQNSAAPATVLKDEVFRYVTGIKAGKAKTEDEFKPGDLLP